MKFLAVSLGDPASIGAEVFLKAMTLFLQDSHFNNFGLSLFGSKNALSQSDSELWAQVKSNPRVQMKSDSDMEIQLSKGSKETARYALDQLRLAARSCMNKESVALVTGPVDKRLCSISLPNFRGQTGFLKELTNSGPVTMMLASGNFRVSLASVHIPLREVPHNLDSNKIFECGQNTIQFLKRASDSPRIAVLGLNPHASDGGLMGDEEERIILPAMKMLEREFGLELTGPLPPDTAFIHKDDFDAFICMYHDQALIPMKLLNFETAVNVSLGLPFLRTSVDHGTAFDIAGKNKASDKSAFEALSLAASFHQA